MADHTFEFVASEFSFDGKVVKNAPYSAEAVTEMTQRLADGNRIVNKSTANMYRDSEGRTRREEKLGAVGPWASNAEPMQTVFINDPSLIPTWFSTPVIKWRGRCRLPRSDDGRGRLTWRNHSSPAEWSEPRQAWRPTR